MACRQLDPIRYGVATQYVIPVNIDLFDRPNYIYDRFIAPTALEMVNISFIAAAALKKARQIGILNASHFQAAYENILGLLAKDTLPRFLATSGGAQQ
jgi:hypothetical protein